MNVHAQQMLHYSLYIYVKSSEVMCSLSQFLEQWLLHPLIQCHQQLEGVTQHSHTNVQYFSYYSEMRTDGYNYINK